MVLTRKRQRSRRPAAPTRTAWASLDQWLGGRRRYVLLIIVIVSVGARLMCFLELRHSPLFSLHHWDESDMNYFYTWAEEIAAGDWWSRSVAPPLHQPHRKIAADYALMFPDEWQALMAEHAQGDPEQAARHLWVVWCGNGRCYQDPLYPTLIAVTQKLVGRAVGWVFAWQALLGVCSNVLVYWLSRRMFGHVAAVIAAALALFYGPLVFYDLVLLRTALITFAGLAVALLLQDGIEKHRRWTLLYAGMALGVAMVLKVSFVLMAAGTVALLTLQHRRQLRQLVRAVGMLAIGVLIGFSPAMVRNVVAGVSLLATATNARPAFLLANAVDAGPVSWGFTHAGRIMGQTGNSFPGVAIETLKTHPSVSSYLSLLIGRLAAVCSSHEQPNNVNFYYGRLHSCLLRFLPVSFYWIGSAAALGLVAGLSRFRHCSMLYVLLATHLTALLITFAYARYRLPMVAALLPFAGLALARLLELLLKRRWARAVPMALGIGLLAALMGGPGGPARCPVRLADVVQGYHHRYDAQVQAAASEGDWETAARLLGESLGVQPPAIRALGAGRAAATPGEIELALFYARAYSLYADSLKRSGRDLAAQQAQDRAADLRAACGKTTR